MGDLDTVAPTVDQESDDDDQDLVPVASSRPARGRVVVVSSDEDQE